MSKDKVITPEVKAYQNEVKSLKEKIEKLSALPELLDTEKHLREDADKEVQKLTALIEKVYLWAAGFNQSPNAEYTGSWLSEEIIKVLKK